MKTKFSNRLRAMCAAGICVYATSLAAGEPGELRQEAVTDGVWTLLRTAPAAVEQQQPWVRPLAGQLLELEPDALLPVLDSAPLEFTPEMQHQFTELLLPTPDGGFQSFDLVESPIMHPDLAAKFPEIRTYWAQGIDDPRASARLDWTPQGFHAQVLTPDGSWYIDPYVQGSDRFYTSYFKRDAAPRELPGCEVHEVPGNTWNAPGDDTDSGFDLRTSGANLRTYALACAATGEYTSFHGGTVAAGQAAIVTAINRVTGIYEVEVAARLTLVGNNDQLVYTNGNTDPYTNSSGGAMLSQNQSTCDSVIGQANYDVGHVFSTGGGGVAFLGVVCSNGSKAGGVTGLPSPTGDPFYVDYVAHELGHQYGGNHIFNGVNGSCAGGNRNGSTATEIGSGTTIMGYAGICGADNVQSNSDAYFTGISYDEIRALMNSRSCHTQTSTGNNAPDVDAGPNYTIPQQTPFTLTASATDPQNDPLQYCWEQMDTGPAQALSSGDNGSSPLFRSRPPRDSESRTFPRLADIRNNVSNDDEKLPTTARTMTFRVTARDNRAGGGGVDQDEMTITTTGNGPFRVTALNSGGTFSGSQAITWDTANTENAPVNATNVEIALSTDSGRTFPTVLVASTPNDGFETITLPNINTTEARIRVMPVNNIFFDMNNTDFTIEPPSISVAVVSSVPTQLQPNTPLTVQAEISDGFETVQSGTETLFYRANGGAFSSVVMSSVGGDLFEATVPGASCDDLVEFYVSADGSGGGTVTSPADAPTTTFNYTIGVTSVVFEDNFESNLGWTALDDGVATSGFWQRGVPVNDSGWAYDPISDGDGSGSCYMTQNETGNTDVDGGVVRLRSPNFDMSAPGEYTIRYDYYLYLTDEDGTDRLLVEMRDQVSGSGWITVAVHDTDGGTSWRSNTITQAELDSAGVPLSNTMQIRFSANDGDPQSINEAGVDGLLIVGNVCEDVCSDSDADGVCDPNDICPGGDDNVDSDSDGTPDFCDPCPDDANDDSDGDGVCDSVDICPGGDDNVDSDSDGTPDFCDACPNDANDDSDGDGVCDSDDICPGGDDNIDSDLDGTPDFCDPCPDDANDDSDGDGVCDGVDICPGGDDSVDSDSDGTPDFCDPCPLDANDDSDGDGVCDSDDICPLGDDNADADGDGIPDACECPGDVDGDLDVDLSDLAALLADFGRPGSGNPADLNGDGQIDLSDLAELLANFGRTCS